MGRWLWLHGTSEGVNSGVAMCQVPGKEGTCPVPCVGFLASSSLNWSRDQGCSGETGTVAVNIGAMCGAEASQKDFFVPNLVCLPFLSIVQAAIVPVHSHSPPGGSDRNTLPL